MILEGLDLSSNNLANERSEAACSVLNLSHNKLVRPVPHGMNSIHSTMIHIVETWDYVVFLYLNHAAMTRHSKKKIMMRTIELEYLIRSLC